MRKADKALGKQDKAKAVKQLEASLTAPKPADETDEEKEDPGSEEHADEEEHEDGDEHGDEEHEEGDQEDEQPQDPSKEALHKEGRQFKPLHTTEDTVGAIVGGVLVLLGIGGLLLGRRRSTKKPNDLGFLC